MDGNAGDGTSTAPMTLTMAKRLGKAGTLGLAGKCLVAHLERAEAIERAAVAADVSSLADALNAEVRPWR